MAACSPQCFCTPCNMAVGTLERSIAIYPDIELVLFESLCCSFITASRNILLYFKKRTQWKSEGNASRLRRHVMIDLYIRKSAAFISKSVGTNLKGYFAELLIPEGNIISYVLHL